MVKRLKILLSIFLIHNACLSSTTAPKAVQDLLQALQDVENARKARLDADRKGTLPKPPAQRVHKDSLE